MHVLRSTRLIASASLLMLGACADDPTESALGRVSDASIEVVVCNSSYQRQLTFTLSARVDVTLVTAAIDGLPHGDDTVMTLGRTVPDGHTYVVTCVDTITLAGTSTESSGTARVDLELAAADDSAVLSVSAPYSGGTQAFDNCGNVLAPNGCSLADP